MGRAPASRSGPLARLLSLEQRHADLGFAEIRERLARGEEAAWQVFVERYSRTLYTLALHLAGVSAGREELAQETYLAVLARLARDGCRLVRDFRDEARFETYLFAAVRNEIAHSRRRRARERSFTHGPLEGDRGADDVPRDSKAPSIAEQIGLDPREVSRVLTECLASLDARERLVLRLRFHEGLPYRRLAELFGWKDTNAAAYEVTRILRKLDVLERCRQELRWGEPEHETLRRGLQRWLAAIAPERRVKEEDSP